MADEKGVDLVEVYASSIARYYQSEQVFSADPTPQNLVEHFRALDRLTVLRAECSRYMRMNDAVMPAAHPALDELARRQGFYDAKDGNVMRRYEFSRERLLIRAEATA